MTSDRVSQIAKLIVGDMFRASFPNGAKRICVVTALNGDGIVARAITTQDVFVFDGTAGKAESMEGAVCTIDSLYPVSDDIKNTLLAFDRRIGQAWGPLTAAEQRALLDAGALFDSHPLSC
jgi:hypothetical protein